MSFTGNRFNVIRTNAAPSPTERTLSMPRVTDRCDLDMTFQRRCAFIDRRESLEKIVLQEYAKTMGTQQQHRENLVQVFTEIQRFQQTAFGVRIPTRALKILARRTGLLMQDTECDHYAACLTQLTQLQVYQPSFAIVAAQLVHEHQQEACPSPPAVRVPRPPVSESAGPRSIPKPILVTKNHGTDSQASSTIGRVRAGSPEAARNNWARHSAPKSV